MPHNPILSPTHADTDVLILEGVLAGVHEQGARYGLSHARREVLARVLELTLLHVRLGTDGALLARLGELSADCLSLSQTGRPSHPAQGRDGDSHLSDPAPKLPR
jgi:hypothetical protein